MIDMMPPNGHATALLILALLTFAAFSRERLPLQTTSLGVLVLLVVGFHLFPFTSDGRVVGPSDFFSGFGHEALVTISSLMIIGRGLIATGALQPASRLLGRMLERSPRLALLGVLILCATFSGVLNDTPVVVLMMPILVGAAIKTGRSPSETLLPMNYSVLIGGMATTIGTSTNLLVVSIAADLGVRRFGMFDFAPVTAIAAVGGLAYLWLVLPRLLSSRETPISEITTQIFEATLYIEEESPAVGMTLSDVRGKAGRNIHLRKIVRGKGMELVRLPSLELKAGDRLHVSSSASDLKELAQQLGASLHNLDEKETVVDEEHPLKPADQTLADVVVTSGSVLNGRSTRSTRFSERHDVIVIGLHRPAGTAMRGNAEIAETIVRTGDILLVQGSSDSINRLKKDAGLLVLDQRYEVPRTAQAPIALAIITLVVIAAAFKVVPIAVAALAGVLAMIITRCLDWHEASSALAGKVILLVAASLALGAGLTKTGATQYLASLIVASTSNASPNTILVLLMIFMATMTNFVSNNAAAAIGTPIAVSMAQQLNLSPEPLVLAVLFGSNFCYVTPMAYQTNLLVMSAGGYRFADFVRGGLPLAVLMLCLYSFLLPRFFPF